MLVYQRVDEQFATQARHNVGFAPQWHLFGQSFRGTQWSGGCTVVVFVRVLVSWVVFMRLLQHLPRALVRPIDGTQLKSMQQKVDSHWKKNMDVSRNMPKKRMNTCQNAKKFETRDSCYIFLTCLFLGTQETSWFQPCFSRLELHPAGWWHFSWYSSSWATWWWARALHGLRAHQSPNAKNCSYSHEKNVPFSPVVLERSIIFCSKDFL